LSLKPGEEDLVQPLISHPSWCRRADCARTGEHKSAPVPVSRPGDLVGVNATLVQLDDCGQRLVRLQVIDDELTTVLSMPADQAHSLHRALGALVAT
jgi:hypothetical protein